MDALMNPAMVHELALLVYAVAALVKAIWPDGSGRVGRDTPPPE